jgi:pimeloyl-ACP methyl ester carboxylesterase
MSSSSAGLPTPEGPGSVSGAPNLPAGFTGTFTSRYVDTGELRLHAVTGGEGPPLLLVHGWPQLWYQFRLIMPALARDFSVVAVDQRGIGLSDKPHDGYDSATLANDLVAVMDALGHPRFALYGTDVGMPISYALAADHRDRVDRLAVSEAPLPGISPSPPLFLPPPLNERLWHLAFNQLPKINEQLVTGREDIFFGAEFDASAGTHKLPDDAVRYYIDTVAADPDHLRGSFEFYRAIPHHRAEPAAQDRAADPARPGDRRSGKHRGRGWEHDEARRGRRADPGHPRLRPLGRRAGSRSTAGRADLIPCPLPGEGSGAAQPLTAAYCRS